MMKNCFFIALIAALTLPAIATDDADAPKKMTAAEKKAAMLEKYDTDHDGKLSSEERAKMKEDQKKQKEEERAQRHSRKGS